MGLIVNVYRTRGIDYTRGGISSNHDRLTLVNVDGPFDPDEEHPPAMLVRNFLGSIKIVPAMYRDGHWVSLEDISMFGGNYAATSDGRFVAACERLLGRGFYGAVAIHDRIE